MSAVTAPVATRTASASSNESGHIPFARRRLNPDQMQALQTLYDLKTHPSKEERAELARELNMELKAVNVWFQNKRRSMKKKSIAWNRATALMSENAFGMGHRYFSTPANPARQRSQLRRNSLVSLESVVSSRERKEASSPRRPPLTPRKNTARSVIGPRRAHGIGTMARKECLWDHLLSSPPLPPSSPSKETDFLSALPPQSKTLKSLEWACAKDRAGRKNNSAKKPGLMEIEEESRSIPALDLDALLGNNSDADDELDTPENSVTMSAIHIHGEGEGCEPADGGDTDPPTEDFEAAMALLGFKVKT